MRPLFIYAHLQKYINLKKGCRITGKITYYIELR